MGKFYFMDNGFRNGILNIFSKNADLIDQGANLEAVVVTELIKHGFDDVKFWRTQDGTEIDFIIDELVALEVKQNTRKFHAKKYKNFLSHYPEIKLNVVSYCDETELDVLDLTS